MLFFLGVAISFGTRYIPFSLPFTPAPVIQIPSDLTVLNTAEIEKLIYRKNNNYTFFWVEDKGYFLNRDDAINFAKANNNMKVYQVDYNGTTEIGRKQIYP